MSKNKNKNKLKRIFFIWNLLSPKNTMPCTARKADTVICGRAIPDNQTLCGMHEAVRTRTGPNAFRLKQLSLKHKGERTEFEQRMGPLMQQLQALPIGSANRALLLDRYVTESGQLRTRHRIERTALNTEIRNEIRANAGVNPDQAVQNRLQVRERIREWLRFRRRIMRWPQINWDVQVGDYRRRIQIIIDHNQLGIENNQELTEHLAFVAQDYLQLLQDGRAEAEAARIRARDPIAAAQRIADGGLGGRQAQIRALGEAAQQEAEARAAEANPNENMAAFARDKQNVHTTAAVKQVKHNINVIRQIFVPEEYRWNPKKISKTFKEIVYECDLTPKGNWQFASYYCNNAQIYELEEGIFGIMTDGVWQFIRDSEDKACLVKILKTELEDNIGMCSQGNLSRICNVLSGYLPGIGQSESISTILGREFPKIMEMEDEGNRIREGQRILRENNVPEVEWETWLEPLRT